MVKLHVRVMARMSVSFAMSGGNAANGAASSTMRIAAWSSTLKPDERFTSMLSTEPSRRMLTVSSSVP